MIEMKNGSRNPFNLIKHARKLILVRHSRASKNVQEYCSLTFDGSCL